MRNNQLISVLATVGVIAICWMIFPGWLVTVIAFFSILIAVYIEQFVDSIPDDPKPTPVYIRTSNDEWIVETLDEVIDAPADLLHNQIPDGLFNDLRFLSINEAMEQNLINDIGDEDGNFVFYSMQDHREINYVKVQGYNVYVNEILANLLTEDSNIIGDLMFDYDQHKRKSLLQDESPKPLN